MKDLASHILDILQNSIAAQASEISLEIVEAPAQNSYSVKFVDNGKGMDEQMLEQVLDPFFTTRTTRKVGLGLPLLKQNAERTGGNMKIVSSVGKGAEVDVEFVYDHIDRLPTGDIAGSLALTVSSFEAIEFKYKHSTETGEFLFDTAEIKEALEGVPLATPQVIEFMKSLIRDNLKEINAT